MSAGLTIVPGVPWYGPTTAARAPRPTANFYHVWRSERWYGTPEWL